jgi:hypothetical protein
MGSGASISMRPAQPSPSSKMSDFSIFINKLFGRGIVLSKNGAFTFLLFSDDE